MFLNLQQYHTEDCLIAAVMSAPAIDLRWEHRVVWTTQDGSGAVVGVETPGGLQRLRGSYILACDGARSSMRKLLGLGFPGTTYPDRFLIADVRAELAAPKEPRFFFDHPTNPGSTILIHPQPDNVWRIDWQLGSDVGIAAECIPAAVRGRIVALIGDVPYELVWLSSYRFHQRQLDRLRHGRVFFLGDAAHLMAPFGARGSNSAIHDVKTSDGNSPWCCRTKHRSRCSIPTRWNAGPPSVATSSSPTRPCGSWLPVPARSDCAVARFSP
jgi:3-(3-hydroxy-phenyl)propionate hydroxylase